MLYISSFTDRSFPKGSFLCLPEQEISENIKLIGSINIKRTLLLELLYKLLCPCKLPHKYRVFKMDLFKRGRDGRVCFSLKCRQEKEAGKNWFPIEHIAMTSQVMSSLIDRGRKSISDPIIETDQ